MFVMIFTELFCDTWSKNFVKFVTVVNSREMFVVVLLLFGELDVNCVSVGCNV